MTLRSPTDGPHGPHGPVAGALHAWVDESLRLRAGEPGLYILAAAVAEVSSCPPIRRDLNDLLLKGQRRLHWRDEDGARRHKFVSLVARADLELVVVVGTPVLPKKQERARRVCMEGLLHELDQRAVERVWLESRTTSLNKKDQVMVAALFGSHVISHRLRTEHASPVFEPMLWVADAAAGAISAARDGQGDFIAIIKHLTTTIEIPVR